jgi:hypothetical protein
MVNERISDWIKEGLKKGYTKEQLKKKLIEKGYSENEINKAVSKPGKNIIIISVVVIVVIAAIFAYIRITKAGPLALLQKELEECRKDNIETCLAFTSQGNAAKFHDSYYLGKAARENNISICNYLSTNYSIEFCRDYINENLGQCDKLNGSSYKKCALLMSSRKNISLCNDINEVSSKGICFALATQDSSYCAKAADDKCYFGYYGKAYISTSDEEYCGKIDNPEYKGCCMELKSLNTESCLKESEFYSCIASLNKESACGGLK